MFLDFGKRKQPLALTSVFWCTAWSQSCQSGSALLVFPQKPTPAFLGTCCHQTHFAQAGAFSGFMPLAKSSSSILVEPSLLLSTPLPLESLPHTLTPDFFRLFHHGPISILAIEGARVTGYSSDDILRVIQTYRGNYWDASSKTSGSIQIQFPLFE